LEARLVPQIAAGRSRAPDARPIILVATQCIEAGADIDFDVLITECAALDSLRQRFGRLDRLGQSRRADGVIVVRSDQLAADPQPRVDDEDALWPNDPVYGTALATTWAYLSRLEEVDFGIDSLSLPGASELQRLVAPRPRAPLLLPAHLDCWAQTTPAPAPDPDVALWLHGPERGAADVQVGWRADLSEALLHRPDPEEGVRDRIESCYPSSPELMPLPPAAVRSWLGGGEARDVADVEGAEAGDGESTEIQGAGRVAIRWAGEATEVVSPAKIRPGDTIIVPADYGGIDAGNWAPKSTAPVIDLGDKASLMQRGRPVLRLHPRVIDPHLPEGVTAPSYPTPSSPDDPEIDDRDAARGFLSALAAEELVAGSWVGRVAGYLNRELTKSSRCRVLAFHGGDVPPHLATIAAKRLTREKARVLLGIGDGGAGEVEGGEVTTEADSSASFTGVQVTLKEHVDGVVDQVRRAATKCGLPDDLVTDLTLAARYHDLGKLDPRFQRLLHGGSAYKAAVALEPLAKSGIAPGDRAARRRAQVRSGYPRGVRHELVAVGLLQGEEKLADQAADWDLVLHLIGSHHGHCRPFAPAVPDEAPAAVAAEVDGVTLQGTTDHRLARLDSGVSERFWRLVRRYGWFQLAWLEAILRLADHRQSHLEQQS
jgi:CRISPR-associated endonuclease/helicase Cas3